MLFNSKNCFLILFISLLQLFYLQLNAEKITIGYYNPDNPALPSDILRNSDNFFSKNDYNMNVFIQPILRLEEISDMITSNEIQALIISPVFKNTLPENKLNRILLRPIDFNGTSSYNKLLIVNRGTITNTNNLINKQLASASYGKEGYNILEKYFFKNINLNVNDLQIIWVRKDFDAIFALQLGQVDAALISQTSLNLIVNEAFLRGADFDIISKTSELEFPLLYVKQDWKHSSKIKKMFLNKDSSTEGVILLNNLGMQKWVEY